MIDYGYGVQLGWVTEQDKDQFFHWRNDPEIWYWCRQNGLLSLPIHRNYWFDVETREDLRFFSIIGKVGTLGAAEPPPKLVGCCGLTSIDHINSRAEFSLYIGPEHQGHSFGEKALKTLIEYGFRFLNLETIWGETFEGNPALKTFLKIGMTKEGTRRHFYFRDGKYIDAHLVSVLRSEWKFSS